MHHPRPEPDAVLGEHEAKFRLDARRVPAVRALLRARAAADCDHADGLVNSVYYDTLDLTSFEEKRNSDYLKSKVRARWYADPATGRPVGRVFLEAKLREGTRRAKHRIETDLPAERLAAAPLDSSFVRDLVEPLRAAGALPLAALLPVFEVAYRRRRYVDPATNARLSLDTDIRVARTNALLFPTPPPLPLAEAVLEVKDEHGDLPPALEGLRALGCNRDSFSKYGACAELVLTARHGRRPA